MTESTESMTFTVSVNNVGSKNQETIQNYRSYITQVTDLLFENPILEENHSEIEKHKIEIEKIEKQNEEIMNQHQEQKSEIDKLISKVNLELADQTQTIEDFVSQLENHKSETERHNSEIDRHNSEIAQHDQKLNELFNFKTKFVETNSNIKRDEVIHREEFEELKANEDAESNSTKLEPTDVAALLSSNKNKENNYYKIQIKHQKDFEELNNKIENIISDLLLKTKELNSQRKDINNLTEENVKLRKENIEFRSVLESLSSWSMKSTPQKPEQLQQQQLLEQSQQLSQTITNQIPRQLPNQPQIQYQQQLQQRQQPPLPHQQQQMSLQNQQPLLNQQQRTLQQQQSLQHQQLLQQRLLQQQQQPQLLLHQPLSPQNPQQQLNLQQQSLQQQQQILQQQQLLWKFQPHLRLQSQTPQRQLSLSKIKLTKLYDNLEDESENYKPIPPIPIAQTQSKELPQVPQVPQEIRNNQEAWNNQEYENNQENQYIQNNQDNNNIILVGRNIPVETKVNYFIGDNSDSTNETNLQQNNLPPPLSQDLTHIRENSLNSIDENSIPSNLHYRSNTQYNSSSRPTTRSSQSLSLRDPKKISQIPASLISQNYINSSNQKNGYPAASVNNFTNPQVTNEQTFNDHNSTRIDQSTPHDTQSIS
ncbi:7854_t:CDS:2, partial [Diversispora eburnea]